MGLLRRFWAWLRSLFLRPSRVGPVIAGELFSSAKVGRTELIELRVHPSGFVGTFEPRAAAAVLPETERPAVEASLRNFQKRLAWHLFERLGLSYAPSDYWEIVRHHPDPVEALRIFAESYFVDVEEVRDGSAAALERLEFVVATLFELDHEGVARECRRQVVAAARVDDRATVEAQLAVIRAFSVTRATVRESADGSAFAAHRALAAELEKYRGNPLEVGLDDLQEARAESERFERLEQRFVETLRVLAPKLAWLRVESDKGGESPKQRDWLRRMQPAIARASSTEEDAVRSAQEDPEANLDEILERLEALRAEVDVWVEELESLTPGGYERPSPPPPPPAAESPMDIQRRHLEALEFPKDATPSAAEIRARLRKLAAKYHPDKFAGGSKAQRLAEAKMKAATEAQAFFAKHPFGG